MTGQSVTLNPSESKVVSFEAIPHEAKTYQVSVDGLEGSFTATPPPTVVDGGFVIAYAWWEGLPSWIEILLANEWPANTAILTKWKVANIGNVATNFRVEFVGQSRSITLNPRESDFIELTVNTGDPGDYSYITELYANGVLVDSSTIAITVVSIKPDYLNAILIGDIFYYSGNGAWYWSITRNWFFNIKSLARFPIKNTGSIRAPAGIDFMGTREAVWLNPGQSINWETAVQALEGTHTYPYYIFVRDPNTGQEWITEEGNLTITGIYF